MARVLVQLKLRLVLNALRSSTAAQTSFILSTFFAFVVGVGGFYVLSLFRGLSASVDLTTVIFTAFALSWLILPIFAFGLDGTLDPATLQLYPLRTRPLAVGLLAASAAGAWPAANLLGLLGVTVGLAVGVLGVLVAVVAVVLQVLFCITLARLVTTSMARLLRSRRGKDLAVFLFIPIFALLELLGQVIPNAAAHGGITAASFAGVDAWMRWLPPGLAAHAIQDASHGHPGTALARLGLLAAVIIVLGWLWVRSLDRALVTADTSTGSSQLRGTALPLARYGLRGVVAARFWIYQRRDPTSLVYWAMTAVIMVVVSASTILGTAGPHKHPGVVIGSAVVGAGFVAYFHANSVGLTGPPFITEALALTGRRSLRAYFSGQNIALGVIAAPLLTAICFGLAAAVRSPAQGVPAAAVALAGLGAGLGLSNILTVTLAYPMAKRTGSPMRQAAQGFGSYTFGGMLASVAGVAVATTPVILAAAFTSTAPAAVRTPLLIICSAAYGLALAWAGVQIAAREAEGRLPELCQIAIQSTV
jgi:ABC-2 type transport system permease protein